MILGILSGMVLYIEGHDITYNSHSMRDRLEHVIQYVQ